MTVCLALAVGALDRYGIGRQASLQNLIHTTPAFLPISEIEPGLGAFHADLPGVPDSARIERQPVDMKSRVIGTESIRWDSSS